MPTTTLNQQHIHNALHYIDTNGIPPQHDNTKYALVTQNGRKYPVEYLVAVAQQLATGTTITTEKIDPNEAKKHLHSLGFQIQTRQQKYELTITAENITSTDERFTMNNLSLGDQYKPLAAYLRKADGRKIERRCRKGERRISNMTMPRIACQVFEKHILSLSTESKHNFPICQYSPGSETIRGIFPGIQEFRENRNTYEYLTYAYGDGRQFVFYCWNVFSTIIFVQECLKRFGDPGDAMILTYREKDEQEDFEATAEAAAQEELVQQAKGYQNPLSTMLIESKNLILRGASGTGKSYLAKEIAADIISDGYYEKYSQLSAEQQQQVEFV